MATKDWRPGEIYLASGLRYDITGYGELACRPRRDDLPTGATDGVECPLDGGPADRVGAYLFPDDGLARAAYDQRLAENGLAPDDDGGCPFAGDDAATFSGPAPATACFANEFGKANLRMFWPGVSVVVGVLGRNGDRDALAAWARDPAGTPIAGLMTPWMAGLGERSPLAACPEVRPPARVKAPTTIVYETEDEVWLSGPDGSHRRRLVANGWGSEWSPDGRQLAYVREGSRQDVVRILDPASGLDHRLAAFDRSGGRSTTLRWSPNGRWVGVTAMWDVTDPGDEEGDNARTYAATWLVDPSTGATKRLHDGVLLAWLPDSAGVLIGESEHADGYGYAAADLVEAVDVERGAATILGRGRAATSSPDCAFVALETSMDDTFATVVIDGVGRRPRLATESKGSDWAPDVPELAVGVAGRGIWRVCLCDGEAVHVGAGTGPSWSDSGARLAVFRKAGLFSVGPDGSAARLLARSSFPIAEADWSPDGRFLASSDEVTIDTCGPRPFGYVVAGDGSGVRALPSPYHYRWRPV
jgi:hypothetical protein